MDKHLHKPSLKCHKIYLNKIRVKFNRENKKGLRSIQNNSKRSLYNILSMKIQTMKQEDHFNTINTSNRLKIKSCLSKGKT